ncbi:choice-of-anchor I family protein [Polaribacter sp. Asnod6-C07]|uniref:choice-of-anchor I family protein n=1 Tax=Polaribacter sp. Asnod6-C07 TaxID=3160582 RepID=UPI003864B39F
MKKTTLFIALLTSIISYSQINLKITEIFAGQEGTDLTEDWFEIQNTGTTAWVSGIDPDLYYDDDSADADKAVLINGITDLQPGERAIVLITGNTGNEIDTFSSIWSPVINLSNIEIGYTDGSGLGAGGDAVTLWLGNPNNSTFILADFGTYPDTAANDGQSYDLELAAFSTIGNISYAVETSALGGDANNVPNIASPGNVVSLVNLVITEIFPGQEGTDLTADWFEIHNTGNKAWVSGTDDVLYYDDDSADPTKAVVIQGITDIQPGERAIVLVTDNTGNEVNTFNTVWSSVVDLTGIKVGYTDGSGLGAGGDAVALWMGDPSTTSTIAIGVYPDTAANDGQSYDLELASFSTINNTSNAIATQTLGGDNSDVPNIASPGNIAPPIQPIIEFNASYISVSEADANVNLTLKISSAPATTATVNVSLLPVGSATEGSNFTFSTSQTVTFSAGNTDSQTLTIPILNNNTDDSDLYFMVKLENQTNSIIGNADTFSVYILDDDTDVPTSDDSILNANYLDSYVVDASGTAEITAYDAVSQRLFVTNSTSIEILDFSNPSDIKPISTITLPANTSGVQSVAVYNGLLAAAIAANPATDNGMVLFSDIDGNNQISVTVGSLPDMLTFTPDGTKLLVANEGQPNDDYSFDPEGSISIIDVTGGLNGITQTNVNTLDFKAFNSQEAALKTAGVRIFGPGSTVAEDLEPEYITVSDDNLMAYVSLQENNAYAVIDLSTNTITKILPLGLKDHSLAKNSLDTSDETDFIFNASWPIYGMYMPDAISYFNINGTSYIATANEGDAREYGGLVEERKLNDSDYILDPAVFGDADILALSTNLGDINVTNASGNTDDDAEFEEIHVFGGRSFSIFEANTGNIVYDSGNDFEVITAADNTYGSIFNASNTNNSFKNRSDNKGPEPEGILVKEIEGSYYAFILLERIGGIMIYDVTNPTSPKFLQYLNSRETTTDSGDLGPEGIVFVDKNESPNGTALIIVSNEVSGTLSIYSLDNVLSTEDYITGNKTFSMFPNPTNGYVSFSKEDDYKIYDLSGRLVKVSKNTKSIEVNNLTSGIYVVTNTKGFSQKLLVK